MHFSKIFLAIAAAIMMLPSCTSAPTREERTDEALKAIMDEFKTVGLAVAVVKDGEFIYNKSFGYKDLANKIPLQNGDVMRIASTSKSFVATGIMNAEFRISVKV